MKVYAGTDPLTGREIRFRKTCKTEQAAQIELDNRHYRYPIEVNVHHHLDLAGTGVPGGHGPWSGTLGLA